MQELQLFIVAFLLQKALVSLELAEVKMRHFDSDAANFFFFLLELFLGLSQVVIEFVHALLVVIIIRVGGSWLRLVWYLAGCSSVLHILLPTDHVLHQISLLIQLLLLLISVEFTARRTSLSWVLSFGCGLLQLQLMRSSNLILIDRKLHPRVLLLHILESERTLIVEILLLLYLVLKHGQLLLLIELSHQPNLQSIQLLLELWW